MIYTCIKSFAMLVLVMMFISWAGTTTQSWTLNSSNTTETVSPGTTAVTVTNDANSEGCVIVNWEEPVPNQDPHKSHDYTIPAGQSLDLVAETSGGTIQNLTIRPCPGVTNASGSTTW